MNRHQYLITSIFIIYLIFSGCVEKKTNAQSEKNNEEVIQMNEAGLEKATFGSGCFW